MKKINIPAPCSENWELMSPNEKGRFCAVCTKCVIDFTQKQPQEIQEIFNEKKEETICGRFYDHQLNGNNKSEKLKSRYLHYVPDSLQNNSIVLSVFSFILLLTGCSKQKEKSFATTGIVMMEEDSIPENKNYIIGEAKIDESDSCMKIPEKDGIIQKKTSVKE